MHPLWQQEANNADSFPIKINGLILLAGNIFQKDRYAKIKIQKDITKPANVIMIAGAIRGRNGWHFNIFRIRLHLLFGS